MKKILFLLLIMVFLITSTLVAFAKSEKNMEIVCWENDRGEEQTAYFMTNSNGIIHRFKEGGRHDIYKPVSKFDFPGEVDWKDWKLWVGKEQGLCDSQTPGSYNDYLEIGEYYWHKHN